MTENIKETKRRIEFEELNFKEFISGDIFSFKIPVGPDGKFKRVDNEDKDIEIEDEEYGGSPPIDMHPSEAVYEAMYQIKKKYIGLMYQGMKPFMFHTNFKITKTIFKKLDGCNGVEFLRCLTQYRGVICFGKLFDVDDTKVKVRRCVQEFNDIWPQIENIQNESNHSTTTE